jgi:tRNA(Ile)-lysidine synthase
MARSRNSVDDALKAALSGLSLSPAQPVAIAFSGGLDSSVLLHATVRQVGAASVVALHVNHGLQPAAGSWAAQCADQAARLAVRLNCLRVPGPVPRGANVEGWAREQRYRLLYAACRDAQAQALLTAHHADDQLETLLLALARGSGLDGLCGMAPRDVREQVLLLRPLLDLPRGVLRHEAQQTGLQWIEDPSNADVRLRRNALRHQVLPALAQTLPELSEHLPEVLDQLRQAREVVHAQARADLTQARCAPHHLYAFDRRRVQSLPDARIAMLLRAWLREINCGMPTVARLEQMRAQLIDADGAQAELRHDGHLLRRYRDCVVAQDLPLSTAPRLLVPPRSLDRWQGAPHIDLPGAGRLYCQQAPQGLSPEWLRAQTVYQRSGIGSDRLRTRPSAHSRTLRNLWQEAGIPPWVRPALPVLCVQGRVLMAAPFGMDCSSDWPWSSPGIRLHWAPEGAQADPELAWFDPRAIDPCALRPVLKPGAAIE